MDFLKKHGEKLLFIVLLALLGGSVALVLGNSGLGESAPKPMKKTTPVEVDVSRLDALLAKITVEPPSIEVGMGDFTAGHRVYCRNPEDRTLIPYGTEICPYCDFEQGEGPIDSDGDGIYDEDEIAYGMDPNDPNDVFEDHDGDGFPSGYEVKNDFLPNDPESRPALADFMRLKEMSRSVLTMELRGVSQLTDEISSLQMRWLYPGEQQWQRDIVRTGSTFGRRKEFTAVNFVESRRWDEVQERNVDESYATIRFEDNEIKLMRSGTGRRGNFEKSSATLQLIFGPEWEQVVTIGSSFELDKKTYKVVDIQNEAVVIQQADSDTELTLRKATQEELDELRPPEPEVQDEMMAPEGFPFPGGFPGDQIP